MSNIKFPTYDFMMNPLLQAIRELGGSGTNEEINQKTIEILDLPDTQLEVLHNPDRSSLTEVEYRLAWTKTYLKKYGALENSKRGVWALTAKGNKLEKVNPKTVVRSVREQDKKTKKIRTSEEEEEGDNGLTWRDHLLATLLGMEASAFERLAQRLLRESGFIQVEVTGRSGDGGIDGKGVMRLAGLLSFHVLFQCKKYKGTVNVSQVRDFRGAMVGRADKGLLITTGNFTKDAIIEATRDGAPPIDLIDGDLLIKRLEELELGIKKEQIVTEQVTIDKEWFASI